MKKYKLYKTGQIVRTFMQDPKKGFVPCFGVISELLPESKWISPDIPLYKVMMPNGRIHELSDGLLKPDIPDHKDEN